MSHRLQLMDNKSKPMRYKIMGQGPSGPWSAIDTDPAKLERMAVIARLLWWQVIDENGKIISTKKREVRRT